MAEITPQTAVGKLQLYDYYKPALEAGTYRIEVKQVLTVGTDTHTFPDDLAGLATQEFAVSAPQVSLDSSQIINLYPPSGSTGAYGEVLPHIVLKDPLLPWERELVPGTTPAGGPVPWLALLVFDADELLAGDNPETKATTTSVQQFRALNDNRQPGNLLLVPQPPLDVDIVLEAKGDTLPTACQYITMAVAVFEMVVPHRDELPYLSHVRQIDTGSRPLLGINEHGLFSVTMANRFVGSPPASTTGVAAPPQKKIVHLVSLEGLADPTLIDYAEVALISLAGWTFFAQSDPLQDFTSLAKHLVADKSGEARWLRLPLPPNQVAEVSQTDASQKEVEQRLHRGYAPLAYHTRSGENTFAWYRGPLVPQPTTNKGQGPFANADSALVYDTRFDVFDVSVAAAWELGREAALADTAFGPALLHFRRKAGTILDTLLHQMQSKYFANQATDLRVQNTVQDAFRDLLTTGALNINRMGEVGTWPGDDSTQAAIRAAGIAVATAPSASQTRKDLTDWMTKDEYTGPVLAELQALLPEDITTLASWMGKLLLLHLVPFDNLVPDERMLPAESLRFFYLDDNWFAAALDGALSLGLDSSRQRYLNELVKSLLLTEARQAASLDRRTEQARQAGTALPTPPPLPVLPNGISGLLLRSAMVAGWPNLEVTPMDAAGNPVNSILRIDHLAPDVLLCLFEGVPAQLRLSEPAESLRFGVDDDGKVALRRPDDLAAGGVAIGEQLPGSLIQVWNNKADGRGPGMRIPVSPAEPPSRVLDVTKLVQSLKDSFTPKRTGLSPAAFALQLVKAAEALDLSFKV